MPFAASKMEWAPVNVCPNTLVIRMRDVAPNVSTIPIANRILHAFAISVKTHVQAPADKMQIAMLPITFHHVLAESVISAIHTDSAM